MSDRLWAALESLTDEQRAAVKHPGDVLLVARPGSGKTRTVGMRLATTAREGRRRIAVASYTNVAVDEVKAVCAEVGVVVGPAHYVGTLHSFLIDYVVRPFGHLITGTKKVRLRSGDWGSAKDGNPATGWLQVEVGTNLFVPARYFEHTADGKVICRVLPRSVRLFTTPEKATVAGAAQAARAKRRHLGCGVLSESDAVHLALVILRKYPRIAAAVANRFSEIIVDEAQDTSDLQVACLRVLHDTGQLRSLVLVADPEQSIYGFQGADPTRMLAFATALKLTPPIELSVNFRSSQRICDAAHRFTERDRSDRATGPHAGVDIPPEVVIYDSKRPAHAVERFQTRLGVHGLPDADAVVVARNSSLCDRIAERASPEIASRALEAFARLAALRDANRTLTVAEIHRVETAVLWMISDNISYADLNDHRRRRLRECANQVRVGLPSASLPFPDWIPLARVVVSDAIKTLLTTSRPLQRKPGNVLKQSKKIEQLAPADLVRSEASSLEPRTVHSVKGRSIDAVLFVVQAEGNHGDQAQLLSALHSDVGVPDEHRELLRIAFVAVSRAERYCAVALPHTVAEDIVARYVSMGFERA